MSKVTGRWFRMYEAALHSPKVQRLPGDLFKLWFNCLCAASAGNGRLPDVADLAFMLRLSERKVADGLTELEARRLLDVDAEGNYSPHDWHSHQYQSDSSAERMRRHRKRHSDGDVTSHPPSLQRHGDGTDTDTDTDKQPAPDGAPSVVEFKSPEARYYARAKEVLGRASGGLATKLLQHHGGAIPLAVASVEVASTKSDPREYIGAIIAARDGDRRPDGLRQGRDVF